MGISDVMWDRAWSWLRSVPRDVWLWVAGVVCSILYLRSKDESKKLRAENLRLKRRYERRLRELGIDRERRSKVQAAKAKKLKEDAAIEAEKQNINSASGSDLADRINDVFGD